MIKLGKYLKKSAVSIVIVILLLILQAYCDLSLPSYTSDIIDVGIQQGGITDKIPVVIRESTMRQVLLMALGGEREQILDGYELLSKDTLSENDFNKLVKKYPVLSSENIYRIKDLNAADQTNLESVMGQLLMLQMMFSVDSEETEEMKNAMTAEMPEEMKSFTIMEIFSMLPAEQLAPMVQNIRNEFSAMSAMLASQGAVTSIKAEYNAIGINVDKIQNNYIILAGLKMLGLALLAMAAAILVGLLSSRIAASFSMDVRGKIFHKVVGFSNSEFDKFSTASLITRSTNDIQQVQMFIVMMLRMVIYAPILGFGGVFKVFRTNVSMAWIIGLAVILIMLMVIALFALAMPKFKAMQKLLDKLNLVSREILTGLPVIRAFSTEKHEQKRFLKSNTDLTKTSLFVNRVMSFMMPAMMLIMNGIMVLILWYGGHGVNNGDMQVGDMMAFMQYAMQIIMSFLMICMMSIMMPRAAVSGKRINEILDTEIIIKDKSQTKGFDASKKGFVEFDHVSFRYPGADENVLNDLNFTAKPGETTAIIGSTGSGKSTLINLIPRLYDVTEGTIRVDGVDIRDVAQNDLRDKIGLVPQKGILFSGTIDSNLRYGKQEAVQGDIERAARIAQASDFINDKDDKYQEEISQGGTNVSGGQKQRLAIARAIAKDPEIYIFDDSFSALDYKTDVALRKTLKQEITESTIIIVAQRISTILNAERILVLEDGKIVGSGTHQELMKTCEVYEQIAASQLSQAELDEQQKGGAANE